jgi:hypothetical protein
LLRKIRQDVGGGAGGSDIPSGGLLGIERRTIYHVALETAL